MRWLLLLPLLTAMACFAAPTASALTIEFIGADGSPGVDGEGASATAAGGDPSNAARAVGGAGGAGSAGTPPGDGGPANATATVAAAPDADARAEARGGDGGNSVSADAGGAGGGAMASASAEGSLSALAYALAAGGRGGSNSGAMAGAGGAAAAHASARSSGDGHAVLVGDPEPLAPLTGAFGGHARSGTGPAGGGDAASESIGEALGNSSVQVFDHAFGGIGVDGGAGGSARSSAVGRNQGSEAVEVFAGARGGPGGELAGFPAAERGGAGGEAQLGMVYGASIDGDVRVTGSAIGGSGGRGHPGSGRPAGDGASVLLENAVDGDTSGSLYLEQHAGGGRAGDQGGGAHGATSSRLEVSKSAQALEIVSLADGALDAESRAIAVNAGGGVTVRSEASGGPGRFIDQPVAERGGDARALAVGRSEGDGSAVVVAPRDLLGVNALGGRGAGAISTTGEGGRGGDATSSSHGEGIGDSSVSVEDQAIAGDGGFGSGAGGAPGIGGSAFSWATGFNAGSSPVHVTSQANGGRGGAFDDPSSLTLGPNARGGAARAESEASGFGEVVSHATAVTGRVGGLFGTVIGSESGMAQARASANGASGEVRAEALATGLELRTLRAESSSPVLTGARVESRAAVGDSFVGSALRDFDAFAIAAGRPKASDVQAAIQGNALVGDAFADDQIDVVLSLGQIGFVQTVVTDGATATRQARLEVVPNVFEVSVLQDVMLGFTDPEFLASGFDSLHFRANLRGETLVDESFDELGEALAYFDDRVLELGSFDFACPGGLVHPTFCFVPPLELIFDWTGSDDGSGFGVEFIVGLTPVPEPSSGLLLALGLALLAARPRRCSAAI